MLYQKKLPNAFFAIFSLGFTSCALDGHYGWDGGRVTNIAFQNDASQGTVYIATVDAWQSAESSRDKRKWLEKREAEDTKREINGRYRFDRYERLVYKLSDGRNNIIPMGFYMIIAYCKGSKEPHTGDIDISRLNANRKIIIGRGCKIELDTDEKSKEPN